jgi:hypothetical protein
MLELNTRLESQPDLLAADPQGRGYIAVVYPDSELPDFHNFSSWKLKQKLKSEKKYKTGMCFDWIEGKCSRGSDCKYTHVDLDSLNSISSSSGNSSSAGPGDSKRPKLDPLVGDEDVAVASAALPLQDVS